MSGTQSLLESFLFPPHELTILMLYIFILKRIKEKRTTSTNTPSRSIINEAAAASPKQPIVNMGQGFFGYNPPDFILNAAKDALDRVECNQYSPTKGRPRLKKAIADAYSPFWGRKIDPETEVTITTGANEGAFFSPSLHFLF